MLDPNQALIEKLTVDPSHIKRLAAAYLKQSLPESIEPSQENAAHLSNVNVTNTADLSF